MTVCKLNHSDPLVAAWPGRPVLQHSHQYWISGARFSCSHGTPGRRQYPTPAGQRASAALTTRRAYCLQYPVDAVTDHGRSAASNFYTSVTTPSSLRRLLSVSLHVSQFNGVVSQMPKPSHATHLPVRVVSPRRCH
ncbi:hypothetical protein BaRGS_00027816 [Batillaria attramentaria]|uniref:Uncharacterized protein n=1 Tax=Batillaria attramentaria TaxID=370345 RepID=A0ABD0K0L0_9CAEN